jgi:hypothetical protein
MTRVPPKAHEAVRLARDGVRLDEIARRLSIARGTARSYLWRAEQAGLIERPHVGPRFIQPKAVAGRSRLVGVRLSTDVVADLVAEARDRDRPLGWVIGRIVTAAVDGELVATLVDGGGEDWR